MGADESSRVLIARIAQAMMVACPAGWLRAQVRYRAVGPRTEYESVAVDTAGRECVVPVPAEVLALFAELRRRQHCAETGPWFSARVRLAHPDRFALDTDAEEPQFRDDPPEVTDYAEDVAALPWPEDACPPWLRAVLDAVDVAQQVRGALTRLGAPTEVVTFSNAAAPGPSWVVARNTGGWWARGGTEQAQEFATARAAAAFAVGQVALLAVARQPVPVAEVFRATHRIDALAGEPPLTLYRGLHMVVLPSGTMLDRLGAPRGNVTYLAGTPFPMRSLPPELGQQPCSSYRVGQPVEVLVGEAVAWFGQPGGGTAFVLPASVAELLQVGVLEAV